MRYNTKDMMSAATRGIAAGLITSALVMAFVFASGDASMTDGPDASRGAESGAVAGVLLSPRTRLIIDYQRSALA